MYIPVCDFVSNISNPVFMLPEEEPLLNCNVKYLPAFVWTPEGALDPHKRSGKSVEIEAKEPWKTIYQLNTKDSNERLAFTDQMTRQNSFCENTSIM